MAWCEQPAVRLALAFGSSFHKPRSRADVKLPENPRVEGLTALPVPLAHSGAVAEGLVSLCVHAVGAEIDKRAVQFCTRAPCNVCPAKRFDLLDAPRAGALVRLATPRPTLLFDSVARVSAGATTAVLTVPCLRGCRRLAGQPRSSWLLGVGWGLASSNGAGETKAVVHGCCCGCCVMVAGAPDVAGFARHPWGLPAVERQGG